LDPPDILGLLGRLVDKSLVIPVDDGIGGTRYRLLETVREYGDRRLRESGELINLNRAHLSHFLDLAEAPGQQLFTDALSPLNRMDLEQDNFRLAFAWATQTDPDLSLRLSVALWQYWNIRGHLVEGREALAKALASGRGDRAVRCLALARAGQFAWYADDEDAMIKYAEEAIGLGRTFEPSLGLIMGLFVAGAHALAQGKLDVAEKLYQESVVMARETGLNYSAFASLGGLYYLRMQRGEFSAGHTFADEYLREFDVARFPFQHCIIRSVFPIEELIAGDYDRATEHLAVALPLARQFGFYYWGGIGVRAASYIAARQKDYVRCWQLFGASQALRDHIPFSVRGQCRSADQFLDAARLAVPPAMVAELIEEGERMSPNRAFDLALEAIAVHRADARLG
jgi:tetratricopeptide (TPR) repeat protein